MIWLTLATIMYASMSTVIFLLILRTMSRFCQTELAQTRSVYKEERQSWEVERERLLNRAMTKTWESYTQMTSQMSVAGFGSNDPPVGLSDEREAELWAQQNGGTEGIGEVFATLDDAVGLGLNG